MTQKSKFLIPFDLQCSTCHSIISSQTSVNSSKQQNSQYLSLPTYEHHFSCPYCSSTIVLKHNLELNKYDMMSNCSKYLSPLPFIQESNISRLGKLLVFKQPLKDDYELHQSIKRPSSLQKKPKKRIKVSSIFI